MKFDSLKIINLLSLCIGAVLITLTTSCTVDQDAGLFIKSASNSAKIGESSHGASSTGKKEGGVSDWAKRIREAQAKREKERAAQLAAKKKEDREKAPEKAPEKARELAEKKKAEAAKSKALAEKEKEKVKEAKKKKELAEKAKIEKGKKAKALAEQKRKKRQLASPSSGSDRNRSAGAGMFGGFLAVISSGGSTKYKSEGHYTYVNQMLLPGLTPANAKIEIDLGDQRVRVFKTDLGDQLVIESSISTGKSGHHTPAGSYRIKEKKVEKRSTLYGTWVSSDGSTVPSSGDANRRPSGASHFVGASMPYWMRITGGVGMHIGYVPNYPASHGCVRVPSAIQPLIYSKVGVGTRVTIKH